MNRNPHKNRLRNNLCAFLKAGMPSNREFRYQLSRLEPIAQRTWLFGGFARDIFLHGRRAQPKDVDLVVEGEAFDELSALVKEYVPRKNRFGGLNFRMGGVEIDAWRLEDTWAFRQGYFGDRVGPGVLPRTTFLTLDAVAIQLRADPGKPRKVCEHRFFGTIERGLIEVNLDENPFPELTIVRTLHMAHRNRYALSFQLLKSLRELIVNCQARDLFKVQVDHYKNPLFSVKEFSDITRQINHRVNLGDCRPFHPFPDEHQQSLGLLSPSEEALIRRDDSEAQLKLL